MKLLEECPTKVPHQVQPEDSPESGGGSVPLHVLCENCERFAKGWDSLDFSECPIDDEDFALYEDLCTVEDLLESLPDCHLCQLIYAVLKNKGALDQVDPHDWIHVWLNFNEQFDEVNLSFRLSSDVSPGFLKHLTLSRFENEEDGSSPPPLRWCHMSISSRDNIRVNREWLKTCLDKHVRCRTYLQNSLDKDQRPTRVLDLSYGSVRLECNTTTIESFEYISLSHMWGEGENEHLRLKGVNLAPFQSEIPYDELSFIYKEAIRITRSLGYRYLWIDSLCIIQDSKEDWEVEASKMASVYGMAICNISYLFPPETAAPKARDDPRSWAPCVLRSATKTLKGLYISRSKYERDWLKPNDWPLLSRAWVFQEYLLCPRNIFYGHKALMWECSEMFCDEFFGKVNIHWGVGKNRVVSKSELRHSPMIKQYPSRYITAEDLVSPELWWQRHIWSKIVDEYRSKILKFSSDRVMAFAGVARAMHSLYGLTYLAGVWRETLPLYLAWSVKRRYFKADAGYTGGIREHGVSTAPSWSWFSVPIRYGWPLEFRLSPSPDENTKKLQRYIFWTRVISTSWDCLPAGRTLDSCFYDFTGLVITVELITLPGKLVRSENGTINLYVSQFGGMNIVHPDVRYYHDNIDELSDQYSNLSQGSHFPNDIILGVVVEFERKSRDLSETYKDLEGLVLAPSLEGDRWRRIGMWSINKEWPSDSTIVNGTPLFHRFDGWKLEELTLY